jgi:hypothetical protein
MKTPWWTAAKEALPLGRTRTLWVRVKPEHYTHDDAPALLPNLRGALGDDLGHR